ncbi:hypothetical protein Lesp02_72890 [Lentzea sp. NBRC 105346]|uniref:DUF6745 domain-containing protein n=1 Tax=Lentzea sp. NBRC 105346 TaxID=3032205 RepID=UPI0024A13EAC|nr:hypothetical protein [Lentzea sp. NBRC 105346]GLZ35102.1 hypothetical protein Lesp02_72890 [Lentzea sp. NBRC 105346]
MSARRRRESRRVSDPARSLDLWFEAVEIRNEWQGHALRAAPADREAAERAITTLYALAGRPKPRFDWTGAPSAAAPLVPPSVNAYSHNGFVPLESELANLLCSLRGRLDEHIPQDPDPWWRSHEPPPDPIAELRQGGDLVTLLHRGIRNVLAPQLEGLTRRIRQDLPGVLGIHWYGQHEAAWIAHYDVFRRALGVEYSPEDSAQLELWATLARTCGWWWPREDVCVLAERPSAIRVEPVPGTAYDEFRLHGRAIEFPDGSAHYAWHGTPVPDWVVEAPAVDRIIAERNVEVRRCAIEHIGWGAFIEGAGMELVSQSPDPGNPGSVLRLYDLPAEFWSVQTRLLLAVNGSLERDGTRRRYGLFVPSHFDHPLDAAGWTYGLTGAQYARLQRRT